MNYVINSWTFSVFQNHPRNLLKNTYKRPYCHLQLCSLNCQLYFLSESGLEVIWMGFISFLSFFSLLLPRTLEQSIRIGNREHQCFLPETRLEAFVVQSEVMSYCGLWCQMMEISGLPLALSTAPTSPHMSKQLTALASCQCLKHASSFCLRVFAPAIPSAWIALPSFLPKTPSRSNIISSERPSLVGPPDTASLCLSVLSHGTLLY